MPALSQELPPERAQARPVAVAIKDDDGRASLPRIVAKGHGTVAEQILALAFAHDVKVREDADLVEILEAIDVDSEIPLSALAAVAEILTYLYRANGNSKPPPADPVS